MKKVETMVTTNSTQTTTLLSDVLGLFKPYVRYMDVPIAKGKRGVSLGSVSVGNREVLVYLTRKGDWLIRHRA